MYIPFEPAGPSVTLPNSPLDVFTLLFTPDIMKCIVNKTNRYAAQCSEGDTHWSNR